MASKDDPRIEASERTFKILEVIKEQNGASLTDIAEILDISKSSVHYHIKTLMRNKFIIKEEDIYRPGLEFLRFGEAARNHLELYHVGKPEVECLSRKSGELAHLLVEEHGDGVYLYRSEGEQAVDLGEHSGMRFPLHTKALGKAILANLPEDTVYNVIGQTDLQRKTSNTITDFNDLIGELDDIRAQGYAFEKSEWKEGLNAVAAPVTDDRGIAIGAVDIAGPRSRMKEQKLEEELPERVISAANVIELNLSSPN